MINQELMTIMKFALRDKFVFGALRFIVVDMFHVWQPGHLQWWAHPRSLGNAGATWSRTWRFNHHPNDSRSFIFHDTILDSDLTPVSTWTQTRTQARLGFWSLSRLCFEPGLKPGFLLQTSLNSNSNMGFKSDSFDILEDHIHGELSWRTSRRPPYWLQTRQRWWGNR